jgi:nucleotide-binding universal stress UspA family protein
VPALATALVATDFSDEAGCALRRAARMARETGMRGALVHVLPASLPPGMHVRAGAQARQMLALLTDEMKRQDLAFEPRLLSGNVAGRLAEAASEFDMAVAGAHGADVLLDFALGRTSTRLVRQSRRPTLIVKCPAEESYRRVVAAVDFSEPSREACALALQVAPQADVFLVNAFEVEFESSLRLASVPQDELQFYRSEARHRAMDAMEQLVRELALPPERISRVVERGLPPKVILDCAAKTDAELIVLGKHAAGIVEQFLIGSVALQVLERARCDVLVVPATTA